LEKKAMKKFKILKQNLLDLSLSKEWHKAISEWGFSHVYISEEGSTCACNQFPIKHVCVFINCKNGHRVEIGSQCMQEFWHKDVTHLFQSVKLMLNGKTMRNRSLEEAYKSNIFNYRERNLYKRLKQKKDFLTNNEQRSIDWLNAKALRVWTNSL
jgi:hypothetical protein